MINYSQTEFRRDLLAALTVTAISLPRGMAYALLAGVDPRYGLYSAIVVTGIASVFGSSSHLINGPTSAISLVVLSALSMFDPDQRVEAAEAMFLLGVMVGSVQIFIAVFRLGDLTRYISESVILGFMSAAALPLAIGQIGNALGVRDKGTGACGFRHHAGPWRHSRGQRVRQRGVVAGSPSLPDAGDWCQLPGTGNTMTPGVAAPEALALTLFDRPDSARVTAARDGGGKPCTMR